VDQFQLLHDFARAYGSLCWNLAKARAWLPVSRHSLTMLGVQVIPRKDLPKIFSMFTPTDENKQVRALLCEVVFAGSARGWQIDETGVNSFGLPMRDFIDQRRRVIDEVMSAPKRRIDNLLTRFVPYPPSVRVVLMGGQAAQHGAAPAHDGRGGGGCPERVPHDPAQALWHHRRHGRCRRRCAVLGTVGGGER
jgi:hypothetical protein